MNQPYNNLLEDLCKKLDRALKHLEYSAQKTASLPTAVANLSEQELSDWEGFTSRFSRVSEIFLQRYIRTWILTRDPGFSGSFRDFLNAAHKHGLIDSIEPWMQIREMRNRMAHEYEDSRLQILFEEVRLRTTTLLTIRDILSR
jgi:hypothetical protein